MAADVNKNLERAKKFLEKNRFEDAIEAYLAVIQEAPQNTEAAQMLGDLYTRLDHPDRAAVYYGHLFELLVDPRDESKAMAIYNRFLRNSQIAQPPERIARYAFLQQKQNHPEEAVDQYSKAAELFSQANRMEDALFCWERTAQLEPDNLNRQLKVAETASQLGRMRLRRVRSCAQEHWQPPVARPRKRSSCSVEPTPWRLKSAVSRCSMRKPSYTTGKPRKPPRCSSPLPPTKVMRPSWKPSPMLCSKPVS